MSEVNEVKIGPYVVGGVNAPLTIFAGPCVIESDEICFEIAARMKAICAELGLNYVFKASFDKANRTSISSFRGQDITKGMEILGRIREDLDIPVMTDVHEAWHCAIVGQTCDVLQIPAFLCRQTDLLLAAAATGKVVNVKKGQFLAPWDMKNVVDKILHAGNPNVMVCERGASFGYNTLVVDMRSLPIMRSYGQPVVFDGTHSVQQPGGQGTTSGGQRQFIWGLVRAAVATGAVDALFLETHPNPEEALSDSATMHPLSQMHELLRQASDIYKLVRQFKVGMDAS